MRCEIADWGLRISKCKIRNGDWPQNFRNSKLLPYALRSMPYAFYNPTSPWFIA